MFFSGITIVTTVTFLKIINMNKPIRIQRKSFLDKLPEGTKIVHRRSKWGNPYSVKEYGRDKALQLYREYIDKKIESGELDISELRGKNLACFCPLNENCHADILLELANT